MSSQSAGFIPLIKTRVLYLGSSVPLETSLGLESVQQPLRDRYGGGGSGGFDVKVTGIDTILTVFSSGFLLEYVEDPTASAWFPIQSLHVCCSVRPIREGHHGGLRFVPLDSPEADRGQEPPIFAAITRRSKGVKVLECHGFLCKTTDAALALVQCCTHAFQHKEGWLDEPPPLERMKQTATRLIPAERLASAAATDGRTNQPMFIKGAPTKTYAVEQEAHRASRDCGPLEMQTLVVNLPPQPQPQQQPQPQPPPQPQQQPPPPQAPPVPQPPKGYFSNWGDSANQAVMISPQSPFFPGQSFIIEQEERKKKKKKSKKHKKKKSQKEVEYLIIQKSGQANGKNNDNDEDYYDEDDDDDDDVAIVYPGGGQGQGAVQMQEQPPIGYVPYYYDFGMDQQPPGSGMDFVPAFDYAGYPDFGASYPAFDQGGYYPDFGYPPFDQGASYPAIDQGASYPGIDQGGYYPAFGYPAMDQMAAYPVAQQSIGGFVSGYGY